ncbi:helix-hairpin-helix domain-containing protein [Nocardioides sp. MH1]|uniref:helix-hairpin-helix domain-containing protein n=1 Tax=Nocardioides sp. MH1 TaxID=3242490 RepID=UPI0035205133
MRSTRGTEPGKGDRADAAARRLALLAADLGAGEADYTRVVPARMAPLEVPEPDEVVEAPPALPPALPRPGRHASRRRSSWSLPGVARMPGLGAPQLTVLAVIVAAGIALTAWWVVRDQARPAPAAAPAAGTAAPLVDISPTASPAGASASDHAGGKVTVDVAGKVRRPGIVVLDAGARVVDALEAAGGERPGVDLSTLNLARVLLDGEQIVVGAPTAPAATSPSGATPSGAPAALVNLNTATETELESLPDVGPVTAQSIVAWRDANGGFTSIDELLEVDGIGEVTLARLTPYVTV